MDIYSNFKIIYNFIKIKLATEKLIFPRLISKSVPIQKVLLLFRDPVEYVLLENFYNKKKCIIFRCLISTFLSFFCPIIVSWIIQKKLKKKESSLVESFHTGIVFPSKCAVKVWLHSKVLFCPILKQKSISSSVYFFVKASQ